MVSSSKQSCELHRRRLDLARMLKADGAVDTFGTFDGGDSIKIADSLDDYRYTIAVENHISGLYFTEKLMNCFASMTVPIYFGATKIGDFFNTDGIIELPIPDFDSVSKALRFCNETDYRARWAAIIDNYNRVMKYLCIEDFVYQEYVSAFALKR